MEETDINRILDEREAAKQEAEERNAEETTTEQPRIPFSREDLINAHSLRNTDFQAQLIDMIDKAELYSAAKRALKVVVYNFFSQNWFLANLEKGNKQSGTTVDEMLSARLRMELDLLYATCSFCPSDVKSADMANIIQAIYSHFIPLLSRAKGPQREGVMNRKFYSQVENEIRRYEPAAQPIAPIQPQQKKPFLSFLRGK